MQTRRVIGMLAAAMVIATWSAARPVRAEDTPTAPTDAKVAVDPAELLKPVSERFANTLDGPSPSFRRHVIPMMSRMGCSGRACHGSFKGQGGFRLSLFGYDFKTDLDAILASSEASKVDSRVNKADPDESLILLKPTLGVKHEGKQVIQEDKWQYNILRRWIANGAHDSGEDYGAFDRLEVYPREMVFEKAGQKVQLKVLAHWADGTVENVTDLTRFRTNDDSVAEVDEFGVVTCKGPGDSHIVAFYDNGVAPTPVMLPVSNQSGKRFPAVPTPTKIDELIVEKLRKVGIVPADVCTDAEFLRRVSIDLTGTLPTPQQITAFLDDTNPGKRARKIDELLETPQYAAWWTTKLCDITSNNAQELNDRNFRSEQSRQWYDWIYKRVATNVPYDKIVEGIVMAKGRTSDDQDYVAYATEMSSYLKKDHPADFADRETMPHYWARRNMKKPEERALSFSYAFLGVRLECAQCHKHPFDQWTQQDFQHFQAFFEPIRFGAPVGDDKDDYKRMEREMEEAAGYDKNSKTNTKKKLYAEIKKRVADGEPVTWQELYIDQRKPTQLSEKQIEALKKKGKTIPGRVLTPKVLGGDEIVQSYADARTPLMEWLRSAENPYFARAWVNRVWANHFGRGLVAPADDMNLANPPSNAAVLDYLADGFRSHGYDMKWLHREILNSDTYQRSWMTNDTNRLDERNFSRAIIRRLPAEVTWDAIAQATIGTDRQDRIRTDVEDRAIGPMSGLVTGGKSSGVGYAMNIFGKPERETVCDCERKTDATLLQTIYTRNDREVWTQIDGKNGWITELRNAAKKNDSAAIDRDALIREVFLRTVSRMPTADEVAEARKVVAEDNPIDGTRELLWVMLNTKEFIVNH
ncbi:MAG: DUF1549 domain-containing protein [Phycisphaera sp.]|nr:DUF1549 domain-containing protein [Phycisphaera sp.]